MKVLVVRLDSDGDVLLTGPAVRAVAAHADEVVAVVGPKGRQAAALLPGVTRTEVWHCGWVDGDAPPVDHASVTAAVDLLAAHGADEAVKLLAIYQTVTRSADL